MLPMPPTRLMLDSFHHTGSMMNNSWMYPPPKIQTVSQVPLPKPILLVFPKPLLPKPILPTFLEPRSRPIVGRPDFGNNW